MPPLKDNASTFKGSVGGVKKVRRLGKGGNTRTAFRSTIAATTSRQNWSDVAHEVSSGSSEQDEGKRRSLGGASNDENCRLACPYAKLNSVPAIQSMGGSGDPDRRRCWSKSYPNIPRLKQHLYRVHCRPEFVCRRCQQEFATEELLDAHSSRTLICDPGEATCAGRMTRVQEKRIKRKTRGMSPAANWFAIWQILFPTEDPPVSPFFEDQIPLAYWENAFANGLENLSTKIKEDLHGTLLLTQLQRAVLDKIVQQAVAGYSRDVHSHIGRNQTPSSFGDSDGASASFPSRRPSTADSAPYERQREEWSPSIIPQSYLPQSMLTPGAIYPPLSIERDLSLELPQTMQPDAAQYPGQQHLGDYGDLFVGLSLDPCISPLDNTEYQHWAIDDYVCTWINMKERHLPNSSGV